MSGKSRGNRLVPREELRERVSRAALDLFRQRGFDGTSVDAITAAAGVAKGTFFNFFPSKRSVLAAYYDALDSVMARQLRRLDPASPRASLLRLFRAMDRALRAEGDLGAVLFREILIDPTLGARDYESGAGDLRQYKEFFERCRELGSIRRDASPRVAAEALQDLWIGTVMRWFWTRRSFSLSGALGRKLDLLLEGIGANDRRS